MRETLQASVSSWYDFQRQNLPIPKMCFTGSKLLERVPTNLFQKVTLGEKQLVTFWRENDLGWWLAKPRASQINTVLLQHPHGNTSQEQ